MGSGYGTCTATYCHSRGNDTVAPYNDVPLSVPVAPLPAGGRRDPSPARAATATRRPSPPTRACPITSTATPKANKHDIHNTTNAFVCQICHYPTTQLTDTIADTTLHVNGSYDAGPDPRRRRALPVHLGAPELQRRRLPRRRRRDHLGDGGSVHLQRLPQLGGRRRDEHRRGRLRVGGRDADDVEDRQRGVRRGRRRPWRRHRGESAEPARAAAATRRGRRPRTTPPPASPARTPSGSWTRTPGRSACSTAAPSPRRLTPCHTGGTPIVGPQTGVDIRTITTHTAAEDVQPRRVHGETHVAGLDGGGRRHRSGVRELPRPARRRQSLDDQPLGVRQGAVPAPRAAARRAHGTARALVHRRHDWRRRELLRLGRRDPELQRHLPGVPRGHERASPSWTAGRRSPAPITRTPTPTPGTAPTATATTGPSARPCA